MKVNQPDSVAILLGRLTVAIVAVIALTAIVAPAPAQAITRKQVVSRGSVWVKKRVMYSQRASYQGYRRDCSGFVSMAWKLRGSYTTRTIGQQARRVSLGYLLPGDAILTKGHVQLFVGWKNKRRGQFWAMEESRSGRPALYRVKQIKRGMVGLRYRGIHEVRKPKPKAKPKPKPPVIVPPNFDTTTTPSVPVSETPTPTVGDRVRPALGF